jgi:glycerol kinase
MIHEKKYIGAIDQGTTSSRFVIFNHKGQIISISQAEHKQIFPKPGWVEHDPIEIKNNVFKVILKALSNAGIKPHDLSAIGITNQRETTVLWNPKTGKPYHNAIVWQDTRTDEICKKISVNGNIYCYQKKTGLPVATYFSGPKIKWIFDNNKKLKKLSDKGEVLFGTIDSWILWWLTGGPNGGVHATDVTNASRTMLLNINTLSYDKKMLDILEINPKILPQIKSSSEIYGYTKENDFLKAKIPVSSILGDQQAALFGQLCFNKGDAKCTYGTGSFMLLNTGEKIVNSKYGLITTIGYKIGNNKPIYALEGSVAIAGSLVQWIRDNLGFIQNSKDIEKLAMTVSDNGGIYFVPAFSGLFAPYWQHDARGLIIGITHYINKGHIARAVLESTAFQIREIFDAMQKDSNLKFNSLKVDGGMVVNNLLMQFQSDILGIQVIKPKVIETTVLGAAYAAGLAVGFWKNEKELFKNWKKDKTWNPKMDDKLRESMYEKWHKAIKRSFAWV